MKYKAIGFDYNGVISIDHSINQELLKIVDKLRHHGYKVGLLSNYGRSGADMIRKSGVAAHFNAFLASGETGFVKPQPEAFMLLVEKLNVAIQELIYIDDSEYCLSSAGQMGYYPILYTDTTDLTVELRKLGVQI